MGIRTHWYTLSNLALAAVVGACSPGPPEQPQRTGQVVDSALPRDEALHRFRRGLEPVAVLDGAASRDSLIAGFVRAVAAGDTAAVRSLMLNRREFAYLFYPTTPQGLPPYDLEPALMWEMLTRQSDRGIRDAFKRLGGNDLAVASHDCGTEPVREGENRIWGPCTISVVIGADTLARRLTGPVVERNGSYKFVSYTNDLD